MFSRKSKKSEKISLMKNESGITVVEAAFYLPILMLAYFVFIAISFYITQKVVLDSSVSRVCVDAAAYLTDEPKIDKPSPFSGNTEEVYGNPYRHMYGVNYRSLGEGGFKAKIVEKVKKHAGFSLIEGRSGVGGVAVTSEYKDYIIFGELTVNAEQKLKFPLDLRFFGVTDIWQFNSTAKSMVFNADAIINDIDLILDALRWAGFDIKSLGKDFAKEIPGMILDLLT